MLSFIGDMKQGWDGGNWSFLQSHFHGKWFKASLLLSLVSVVALTHRLDTWQFNALRSAELRKRLREDANHWGNRKEIRVTCLAEILRVENSVVHSGPNSCSDSNGTRSRPLELCSYSLAGSFAKLRPSFTFLCNAPSIWEDRFESMKVGLPKQYPLSWS